MKYIDELNLAGKTVFLRADLNVPLESNAQSGKLEVADPTRISATLPSIECALKVGARVVLASHLGRPKGKVSPEFSLKPVADYLSTVAKIKTHFAPDCVGPEVEAMKSDLKPGEVLLLENLRFHPEEEKNDPAFAKALAVGCDVFINDAFATCHRAHASVAAITEHFEVKAGGVTLKEELESFKKAFDNPKRPLAVIFGGAKVSTEMEAVRHVGPQANVVIIGGAMANTFLAAAGYAVGKSLYEPDLVESAKAIAADLKVKGVKVIVPVDVVVASKLEAGVKATIVDANAIPTDQMALDIGPKTVALIREQLLEAQTIIWNGPMGAFETPEFSAGTFGLIDILIESKGFSVVGGGDTDFALHQKHAFDKMGYVSTAGGAFLEMMEGKKLPGVEALK